MNEARKTDNLDQVCRKRLTFQSQTCPCGETWGLQHHPIIYRHQRKERDYLAGMYVRPKCERGSPPLTSLWGMVSDLR